MLEDAIQKSAYYLTTARRREIVNAVLDRNPDMSRVQAEDAVITAVAMLSVPAIKRRPRIVDAEARLERVCELMRTTKYPLTQIAAIVGLSQSRLSRLLTEARAAGKDIPERTSGLRTINMEARAKVLQMAVSGAVLAEMAVAIGARGVSPVQTILSALRRDGETVPHMGAVEAWRTKLHEAKREVDSAARALLTLGRSPSMRGHLEDRLDAAQAKFDALAANKPEGVLTMPKNI